MTKRQIEMLRELIQAEITYATEEWRYEFGATFYSNVTKRWEEFAETFNSTPTEPLEIDV
jgi:hypothetical protein